MPDSTGRSDDSEATRRSDGWHDRTAGTGKLAKYSYLERCGEFWGDWMSGTAGTA
ncbi:hypothetical protein [Microcoleus sp. Z1_B2]|uniref:hypothetical protein n=1 Tax=Microcoleus sp. Z1_B2 TaxID=3055429 RepID=UPI002FD2641C